MGNTRVCVILSGYWAMQNSVLRELPRALDERTRRAGVAETAGSGLRESVVKWKKSEVRVRDELWVELEVDSEGGIEGGISISGVTCRI